MSHIVEYCPLTKLNGSLSRLHSADKDAVLWLTTDQLWLMTRIREEEVSTGTPTYFTGMSAYHCPVGGRRLSYDVAFSGHEADWLHRLTISSYRCRPSVHRTQRPANLDDHAIELLGDHATSLWAEKPHLCFLLSP